MQLYANKIPLALLGLLTVSACTEPMAGGERNRAATGAAIGAGIGAITGIIADEDDRARHAIVGAAIGAAAGGAIGAILERQAQELRSDFGNSQINVVNTGNELIVRMPQDILFSTDSATLRPDLQSDLRVLATNLNKYPDSNVQVVGHTDNTGSAEYNLDLSQRRAQSVLSILTANGVSGSRLSALGRGEDQPIASNLTDTGRAQNRRVEIVIRPYSA